MNNNEQVLNNLLKSQSTGQNTSPNAVPTGTEDEVLITTERVVSIRYKVYLLLILLLLVILIFSFLVPLYDEIQLERSNLANVKTQIQALEMRQAQYESNKELVDNIISMDSQIVSCVNEEKGCGNLPDILKDNDNFSIARSYLLLGDLSDEKMEVNEKKILENIDAFLLKRSDLDEAGEDEDIVSQNITGENLTGENLTGDVTQKVTPVVKSKSNTIKNGVINKIVIGDKHEFSNNLVYVPVELSITFQDKDDLLSFIRNVEQRMPDAQESRLLYKISKITYDVIKYDEPQDTIIDMYLYYYNN